MYIYYNIRAIRALRETGGPKRGVPRGGPKGGPKRGAQKGGRDKKGTTINWNNYSETPLPHP